MFYTRYIVGVQENFLISSHEELISISPEARLGRNSFAQSGQHLYAVLVPKQIYRRSDHTYRSVWPKKMQPPPWVDSVKGFTPRPDDLHDLYDLYDLVPLHDLDISGQTDRFLICGAV